MTNVLPFRIINNINTITYSELAKGLMGNDWHKQGWCYVGDTIARWMKANKAILSPQLPSISAQVASLASMHKAAIVVICDI